MVYTTISYFLLIFFSFDLVDLYGVGSDFFVVAVGLLNSAIIFSASFVLISFEMRFIFDLISSIIFSSYKDPFKLWDALGFYW